MAFDLDTSDYDPYYRYGVYELNICHYRSGIEKFKEGMTKILESDNRIWPSVFNLKIAQCYFLLNNLKKGRKFMVRGFKLHTRESMSHYWETRSVFFYKQKQYSAALDAINRSLKAPFHHKNRTRYYRRRADVFYRLGAFDSALEDCRKSLSLNRYTTHALYRSAKCCISTQKYSQALELLDKAIGMNPHCYKYFKWRGLLFLEPKFLLKEVVEVGEEENIDQDQEELFRRKARDDFQKGLLIAPARKRKCFEELLQKTQKKIVESK